jgi:hypothetical protein
VLEQPERLNVRDMRASTSAESMANGCGKRPLPLTDPPHAQASCGGDLPRAAGCVLAKMSGVLAARLTCGAVSESPRFHPRVYCHGRLPHPPSVMDDEVRLERPERTTVGFRSSMVLSDFRSSADDGVSPERPGMATGGGWPTV